MSTLDLMVDGFPHSTVEGYRKGCRSEGACPGVLDNGYSCAKAFQRYNGDRHYREWVDAGKTPAQIRELDGDVDLARVAAEKDAKRAAAAKAHEAAAEGASVYDALIAPKAKAPRPKPVAKPVAVEAPAVDVEPEVTEPAVGESPAAGKHGTTAGYYAGCRLKDQCPSKLAGGVSCTEAIAAKQRDRNAEKRAEKARLAAEAAVIAEEPVVLAPVVDEAIDFSEVETVVAESDPVLEVPSEDEMISAYVDESREERENATKVVLEGGSSVRFENMEFTSGRCDSRLRGHFCGLDAGHEGVHQQEFVRWAASADDRVARDVYELDEEPAVEEPAAAEPEVQATSGPEDNVGYGDGSWWVKAELYAQARAQVEQLEVALGAERAAHQGTSERLVQMALELDVARSRATSRPQFNVTEMVAEREDPTVSIEPLPTGGARVTIGGAAAPVDLRFDFKVDHVGEYSMTRFSDVGLRIGDL